MSRLENSKLHLHPARERSFLVAHTSIAPAPLSSNRANASLNSSSSSGRKSPLPAQRGAQCSASLRATQRCARPPGSPQPPRPAPTAPKPSPPPPTTAPEPSLTRRLNHSLRRRVLAFRVRFSAGRGGGCCCCCWRWACGATLLALLAVAPSGGGGRGVGGAHIAVVLAPLLLSVRQREYAEGLSSDWSFAARVRVPPGVGVWRDAGSREGPGLDL